MDSIERQIDTNEIVIQDHINPCQSEMKTSKRLIYIVFMKPRKTKKDLYNGFTNINQKCQSKVSVLVGESEPSQYMIKRTERNITSQSKSIAELMRRSRCNDLPARHCHNNLSTIRAQEQLPESKAAYRDTMGYHKQPDGNVIHATHSLRKRQLYGDISPEEDLVIETIESSHDGHCQLLVLALKVMPAIGARLDSHASSLHSHLSWALYCAHDV